MNAVRLAKIKELVAEGLTFKQAHHEVMLMRLKGAKKTHDKKST